MLSRTRPFIVLNTLLLALVGFMYVSSGASAQKKKVVEPVNQEPGLTMNLVANPTLISACAGDSSQVQLVANVKTRQDVTSPTHYVWSTRSGRAANDVPNTTWSPWITTNVPTTTWNLSGLPPGIYQVRVDADNGQEEKCTAFSTATVIVKDCPPPVCPNVVIYCPENVRPNEPATFTANVGGTSGNATPTYNWTISAGKIITGQGTPSIQVDTAGLEGGSIKATLDVGVYGLNCPANCGLNIPKPPPPPPVSRQFDVIPNVRFNDEKARLDNYAIQLQNEPGAQGYIIVYGGRRDHPGAAQRRATRARDYLVNTRGINTGRIVTLTGGTRQEQTIELWVVPNGATPPTPIQ